MITRKEIYGRFDTGAELARKLGMSRQAAQEWRGSEKQIPANRVFRIESVLGISRHELRPDLYPREEWCRCPSCLEEGEAA